MSSYIIALFSILVSAALAFGANTHNLGSEARERQAWWGDAFRGYLTSGCTPTTSGNTTLPTFACNGYVLDGSELVYVTQATSPVGPLTDNSTIWLALHRDRATTVANWTRQGHYIWRANATRPATPAGALLFAEITTSGGAITAVADRVATGPAGLVLDVTAPRFGAVGDGVTDDTTAIQAALDAVPTAGATVYLPPGVYRVTTDLLPNANTRVLGAGYASLIRMDSAAAARRIIHITGVTTDHVTVERLRIDGDHTANFAHQCIAFINGANHGRVLHTWVEDCGQYGIIIGDTGTAGSTGAGGATDHIIAYNLVDMTSADSAASPIGIEIFPKGTTGTYVADIGALVLGNTVLGSAAITSGIKVSFQSETRIIGNTVRDVTGGTSTGCIDVTSDTGALIHGNSCENARLGIVASGNVTAGTTVVLRDVTITGNTVTNFSNSGIFSSAGYEGLTIGHNTIREAGGGGTRAINLQPLLDATGYTHFTISDNIIDTSSIDLQDNGTATFRYGVVANNTVDTGFIQIDGLDIVVRGNVINSSTTTSIQVTGNRMLVDGNHITDGNSASGANVPAIALIGDDGAVTDNIINDVAGNVVHGITLNAADSARLSGNMINGITQQEVFITGSITTWTPTGGRFFNDNEALTAPADTAENTIATITVPRGAFTQEGGLRIRAFGECTGAGGTKTLRLTVGGTTIGTLTITAGTAEYYFDATWMMNAASVAAQHFWVVGLENTAVDLSDFGTDTINTAAGTVVVAVTGQKVAGGDTIRSRALTVELIR